MKIDLNIMAKAAASALGVTPKHAGIFDKMKGHATPENAMNYGLPGVFGALAGAEQVPENRWLGAAGGGAGAMGGSFLGAAAAHHMGGENIGQFIGRLIGSSMGQDVGVRGARLLAT